MLLGSTNVSQDITVNCTPILVFAVGGREVGLVWINDDGKLGIVVTYGEEPFLIKLERTLEAGAVPRASDLVCGAMGLMAVCQPPSPAVFKGCFDAANVMTYWDNDAERMSVLAPLIGHKSSLLVIERGWPNALDFIAHVFSQADRAKIHDACTLYFAEPVSRSLQ